MKDVENLRIRKIGGGVVISVKVVPGSSRDKVAGILGDTLKITTSAAAEKGKANSAIVKTLAKIFSVDKRNIKLISGQTNPRKEFQIMGISTENIRNTLEPLK